MTFKVKGQGNSAHYFKSQYLNIGHRELILTSLLTYSDSYGKNMTITFKVRSQFYQFLSVNATNSGYYIKLIQEKTPS